MPGKLESTVMRETGRWKVARIEVVGTPILFTSLVKASIETQMKFRGRLLT